MCPLREKEPNMIYKDFSLGKENYMDCKYYQDDFCVNAASPCVADYCPCTEYPDLCRYYQGEKYLLTPTYDELYEYWMATKDKSKKKRKREQQLLGQISLFDEAE